MCTSTRKDTIYVHIYIRTSGTNISTKGRYKRKYKFYKHIMYKLYKTCKEVVHEHK